MTAKLDINKKHLELLEKESKNPLQFYYLSFANESGFLGGIVIKAHGIASAIESSHELGINPGGSVICLSIPIELQSKVRESETNRLLSREECINLCKKN